MKKILWAVVLVIILLIGVWYVWAKPVAAPDSDTQSAAAGQNMGTYAYQCDEHVAFTMTPSADMGSIAIAPSPAGATFPPAVTLYKEPASSGVRYVGSDVLFSAHGETVTLGEGDSAITCSPVPDEENAPFNFGD